MNDQCTDGELLEDGSLHFAKFLPGPIERVWAWLTEPEKRALWLAGGATAQEAGGKVEFHFDNSSLTPHDDPIPDKYKEMEGGVQFDGVGSAYEPPHRLVLLWPSADGGKPTEVEFRVTEEGEAVRLELIHRGVRRPDEIVGAAAGWRRHLEILADKLAGRTPEPFWAIHQTYEVEYTERCSSRLATMRQGK